MHIVCRGIFPQAPTDSFPSVHTEAFFDATSNAEVFQHPVALDETPVATLNVAVNEVIHQPDTHDAGITLFESRNGNDEILFDPTLDCADTTHVPILSSDETFSEDSQMKISSVSGHEDNHTIDEGNLEGFTQVQRRRSKTISMNPPNEVTKDEQLYYEVGYSSHPMITRSQ
ncbi:unnamed protein product [Cuscuta europaea]|uniref:Uncharacterized protein n=1 Tax=Cuscuta europaea TaxID=41803 RepID=A0A9P1DY42_CUSEU|nr:unnamed protein product [Cuscuta europaea]